MSRWDKKGIGNIVFYSAEFSLDITGYLWKGCLSRETGFALRKILQAGKYCLLIF
ncbi:hypothetical protein BRYFOR_09829 [Marvinbryantia formatexigens DSM 14469]|uniref:Uncharacterized protein n=1 Tax=Marvinbryantia formatexigens DSM 14469 TaxID=478749 RepID=C6LMC9_9FIRM|nr:hypothetical protein BRYFOR_09829 [Marvinbryantia formatexigens DSM 14469]